MTLVLGLFAALWFGSPPVGAERDNEPVGLRFSESIPSHDRAPLQEGFARTLPLACERTIPCTENCSEDVAAVGLELDGSERNYTLHWVATDPRIAEPVIVDSRCELCSLVELEQQFAVDLARVCSRLDALDAGPGHLELSSDPHDARVRIDGQKVGRMPWSGDLTAGQHTVELRAFGYRPQRHSVAILGNTETRRHFQLQSSFTRGRPSWIGWSTLGLGIAMTVAGTALISVHGKPWEGRCAGDDIDVAGNCRFLLATRPLGIGLVALGAGALAGGVTLIIWAQRDPAQSIAGLQVGGRF